jgi:hypothetical protein
MRLSLLALATASALWGFSSWAETTPITASGDWVAVARQTSAADTQNICMATAPKQRFAIQARSSDIEIRLDNDNWSLPDNVTGILEVDAGGQTYPFEISRSARTWVAASITSDQLLSMVGNMNKASSMTVLAGKAPPLTVSLRGSNAALRAFLDCAGIKAPSDVGSNPFK